MNSLTEESISCPYCGELIKVLIDPQDCGQDYIEDCQVCCRPIVFQVSYDAMGELRITAHDENESF